MNNSVRRKLNNDGAAMMVSIIIIAVLMIFAFSLVLISYSLYASQNKNLASMRNMEACNTLSVALEKDIVSDNAHSDSNLWKYLRCNVFSDAWPYYNPGEAGHDMEDAARQFYLEGYSEMEGLPAKTTVKMYWTLPEGADMSDYETMTDNLEKLEFKKGIRLYIEIQCDTGNQSYKVTDVYKLFTDDILLEENAAALQTELGNIKGNSAFNPDSNDILTNELWTWRHESRK